MNVFIGISALLTLLVVAWVIRPLLIKQSDSAISSEKLNAEIHHNQLQVLEGDLARGIISQQDFETTRDELQLRLLDDTESFEQAATQNSTGFWTAPRMASAIGVSVPVLSLGLYMLLGAPMAINPPVARVNAEDQQITQMINTLAAKLQANPDNPQGWAMMARSYKVVGRFEEAKQAFERAGDYVKTNPDMLVDYAELLGVMAGNSFVGQPQMMVDEALRKNPEHPLGLMIAGVASYQNGDFPMAVMHWEKLLSLLPPETPDIEQVQANIADARSQAGLPAVASNMQPPVPAAAAAGMTPEMINQMVDRLAARLKENPGDLAGWARLARAYKVQGRLEEAAAAYAKTGNMLDTDPDLLTQYADTLAMRAKNLQGKPTELVNKALTIDPKHPMALMMAGQSAFQSGDYAKAIGHWQTALTVLPVNSPDVTPIKAEIADAMLKMSATGKP